MPIQITKKSTKIYVSVLSIHQNSTYFIKRNYFLCFFYLLLILPYRKILLKESAFNEIWN